MFNIAINRGCKLFILFMRSLFGAANKPHHLYIPGNRFKHEPNKIAKLQPTNKAVLVQEHINYYY